MYYGKIAFLFIFSLLFIFELLVWRIDEEDSHSDRVSYLSEIENNQQEELPIVKSSNAIVQPLAVMVKDSHTSVAVSTMLGPVIDISLADLAHQVKLSVHDVYTRTVNKD